MDFKLIVDDLNYDENIFNDEYFLWGMRIPTQFINKMKEAFDRKQLKRYRLASKKIKAGMFNSSANVIGLPILEKTDIKELSEDIDSKDIVIRHGESKSYRTHKYGIYGKRYSIGVWSHQTFHPKNGCREPKDLKNGAGDIVNIFTPVRNYSVCKEFDWFYSRETYDMWGILHPEIYRNLSYILIYYYTKIHNTSFEEMKKKKEILNNDKNKKFAFAYGTIPFATCGLFQIFIGIYLCKNVYIYGANVNEDPRYISEFGSMGDPHCGKTEKAFLRDLISKNMDHIPKKYFPFDLKDKNSELYRNIVAVF